MLNTLTVQELIDQLKQFNPHKPVVFGSSTCIDSVTECHIAGHSVVRIYQKEPPPKWDWPRMAREVGAA